MNPRLPILLLASAALSACAQVGPKAHSDHHPAGSPLPVASNAPAPAGTDAYAEQMARMQDMHRRMQAATTPAQRNALMAEHMQLMHSGMAMMGRMGPASGEGQAGSGGTQGGMHGGMHGGGPGGMQGGMHGHMHGGGMMGMHAGMERRMAMMEMMMQMMVDREAATSGK